MVTIACGNVFLDIDLSFLSDKYKDLILKSLKEKMEFVEDFISSRRIKIVFIEMSRTNFREDLEKKFENCNGSPLQIGKNFFELVIKTSDQYYLKYLIDVSQMKLTIFFEKEILERDFHAFSLTLGGFDYALLNIFLVKYEHLIVHSSAFIYENKGYLFLGHSGFGKSTIYNLVKNNINKATVLCEDRNIIFLKNNEVYLSNFWREFVSLDRERFYNYVVKLKILFFIEKSELNVKNRLSEKKARLKLSNFFFRFFNNKSFLINATSLIFKITTLFDNFYILRFTKDTKFLDFIISEVKMKYKLSDCAVLNKIKDSYFLSDISKPNSKYLINFSFFSTLEEIKNDYLGIDEIFEKLEKKFSDISKNGFIKKTVPILKELSARGLINILE